MFIKYLIDIFNRLFFNLTWSYFHTFFLVIEQPSKVANDIKNNRALPLPPEKYITSGIIYIFSIWSLRWYIFNIKLSLHNIIFAIIFALYIVVSIYLFGIIVWTTGCRRKSIKYTVSAYTYIVGTFLPFVIIVNEILDIINFKAGIFSNITIISSLFILLTALIGLQYIYRFLKIIHQIRPIRAILVFALFVVINYLVTEIFTYIIDYARTIQI